MTDYSPRYDVVEGRTYRKIVQLSGGARHAEVFINRTTGTWYNAKSWSQPNKLRPYTRTPDVAAMWNARLAASGATTRV